MAKAENDSFKDNRRLLYASLMKMFFNSKKRKRWKVFVSFEACLDFFTMASSKKSLTALKTLQLKNILNCHYSINN